VKSAVQAKLRNDEESEKVDPKAFIIFDDDKKNKRSYPL
jgi:hypothetical protein